MSSKFPIHHDVSIEAIITGLLNYTLKKILNIKNDLQVLSNLLVGMDEVFMMLSYSSVITRINTYKLEYRTTAVFTKSIVEFNISKYFPFHSIQYVNVFENMYTMIYTSLYCISDAIISIEKVCKHCI